MTTGRGYRPVFDRKEDKLLEQVAKKVSDVFDERERLAKEAAEKEMAVRLAKEIAEKEKLEKVEKEKVEKEKVEKEKAEKEKVEKEKAEKETGANKITKAIETIRATQKIGDEILCPTCHSGHVHKVEGDKTGLVYKCTKDGCGYEIIGVPKSSDYKCNGCGMAIKKPEDPTKVKEIDGCPFCGNTKAVRFDWQKLWNVKKK